MSGRPDPIPHPMIGFALGFVAIICWLLVLAGIVVYRWLS